MENIKQIFCADNDFCALVAKQNKQNKWEFWGYSGKDEAGKPKYGLRLLSDKFNKPDFDAVEAIDTTIGRTSIKVLQSEKWREIVFIQTSKVVCNDYQQCWEWAIVEPMRLVYVQADEDESLESLLKRGAGIKTILIDLALTTTFSISENSSKNVFLLMEYFLQNSIDVNQIDEWGDTALHYACRGGNTNIVKLLLENGADVNVKNLKQHTAWFYASKRENADIIQLLSAYCADINEKPNLGIKALQDACIVSDVEMVKLLLEQGVDASQLKYSIKDIDWEDWKYQIQILKLLANQNVDVDAADELGMTNLMYISSVKWYDFEKAWGSFEEFVNEQQEIMQLLLSEGTDINAKCHYGKTALHYAVDYTQYNGDIQKKHPYLLAKLLIEKGADINATDNHGTTALMLAIVLEIHL
jgi:ankyrin repeat protein